MLFYDVVCWNPGLTATQITTCCCHRATIYESLCLLHWLEASGINTRGICGLSMGGVHAGGSQSVMIPPPNRLLESCEHLRGACMRDICGWSACCTRIMATSSPSCKLHCLAHLAIPPSSPSPPSIYLVFMQQ